MTEFRIGNGIDVHGFALQAGDEGITLGGVHIPHEFSLLAHSDGDVLTHALIDAILGALALGDIGSHFPDSNEKYKGISSLALLDKVKDMMTDQGWQVGNADITLVAQTPKLSPHVMAIRKSLALALGTSLDRISVKATTSEGLGFTGRREGIAVFATALLNRD